MSANSLPFRDAQQPLESRVNDLVGRLSLDEKVVLLHQYQPAVERLGVGPYKHGTEAAHGISWLGPATAFPQPTGLASTWDPELLVEVGRAIGEEARGFYRRDPSRNGLTLWAPTVDLERDPRWGRTEEAYGEDPFLVAETAGALVRGIQGDHPVYLRAAATLKHFLGNNHEADRGTVSVTLDPRNLHEYFQRPFERIFRRSGAVSMMTAYNAVNGTPCNLNPDVVQKAKREWGCAFVVSDAGDVVGTNREHRWFETLPEAVAANLKAGIDSLTDDADQCLGAVHEALKTGLLSEADVDEAVRNSLRVRFRLGEFDAPGANPYDTLGEEQIGSEAHRAVSRRAAEKSIVLLKNAGALPLDPAEVKSVAVVGPLADELLRDWYSGEATHRSTVASALAERFTVRVESGCDLVRLAVPGRGGVGSDGEGPLAAGPGPGRTFRMTDWGWAAHTFQDPTTGRYLTTDDTHLTVSATEVFGWFTKEVFLVDRTRDAAALATWNALPVRTAADGTLETVPRDDLGPGRIGIDGGTAGAAGLAAVKDLCGPLTVEVVEAGVPRAVAAAQGADAAVVVVGCHPLINAKETVDRSSLALPPSQVALVRAVAAANPRTVVVLVSGYPYALDGVLDAVPAVVHTTHAGPEFAGAVASVLDGTVNPAGRTCLTWYAQETALPPLADYDVMRGGRTYRWFPGRPQFPFGHGLSYTKFEYFSLEVTPVPSGLKVLVRVENTGDRPGDEVVQIYATQEGTVPHPRRQLVAFRRVAFGPRESQVLEFSVDLDDLRHWDVGRGRWTLDQGQVILAAGPSSGDLRVSDTWTLNGEAPAYRDVSAVTPAAQWDDQRGGVLEFCREGGFAAGFSWAAFRRVTLNGVAPAFVEIRAASADGGTVEVRWDGPDGPPGARLEVPGGGAGRWTTLKAPVTGWTETGTLYLTSSVTARRDEGVAWFRFVP